MKVYGYTKDKQGIMEIENSLKAEQAFVGGSDRMYGVDRRDRPDLQ